MTEGQLRDTVRSLDGSLDEVSREQAWRAIERGLVTPPAPVARPRWAIAGLGAAVAVAAALVWFAWPQTTQLAGDPPTVLAAGADQRVVFDREGIVITLHGPGSAAIHGDPAGLHVEVHGGTLLAERTDTAPALIVAAGESRTTSRDRVFAVRVQPGTVVFGAGEQARALIERHTITLAPQQPPPPSPPVVVAPPIVKLEARPRIEPQPPIDAAPITPEPELPPPATAKDIYALAEAALRAQDRAAAKLHLKRLLAEHATDLLADAARYDLALIAIAEQDPTAALDHTRWLVANARDPNLRAAAQKLLAKLAPRE